jgi:hypothetical protein
MRVHDRTQVLFVSSGMDLQVYRSVLEQLGNAAGRRFALAFRPHPAERGMAPQKYGDMLRRYGWQLDASTDPYASLAKSVLVVGDASTTMFEALAFECPVVLIDAPVTREVMPEEVFAFSRVFSSLEALISMGQKAVAARRELWVDDWQNRFRGFLAGCSVGQPGLGFGAAD